MALTEDQKDFLRERVREGLSDDEVNTAYEERFGPPSHSDFVECGAVCSNARAGLEKAPDTGASQEHSAPAQTNDPPFDETIADTSAHELAPFRFIPVNEKICKAEDAVCNAAATGHLHDWPLPEGLSGQLGVTITADNAIMVGGGDGNAETPAKLGDTWVIPGATLKGLTRAAMEIASFARLSQTNTHRRYGIRMFEHALFRNRTPAQTGPGLRAGWLQPSDSAPSSTPSGYEIHPCRWWPIRIRDLFPDDDPGTMHAKWLKNKSLKQRYAKMGMQRPKPDGALFDFTKTRGFSTKALHGQDLVKPDRVAPEITGVPVFCDKSSTFRKKKIRALAATLNKQDKRHKPRLHKKTEAVFESTPNGPAIPVPQDVWDHFTQNNSDQLPHELRPRGNWKALKPTLDSGQRIPVFWDCATEGEIHDFGLVRVFKRAHTASVGEVLARSNPDHLATPDDDGWQPDMVEALFGYVHEPGDREKSGGAQHPLRHLKGRVSFGFLRLDAQTPARTRQLTTTQAQPKPSFGPFYLAGKCRKDWSDPKVRLAGRKRYPARGASSEAVMGWLESYKQNRDKTDSKLSFLVPEGDPSKAKKLRFNGEIRVHNVTPVELGALIWVLELGGDSALRHLIGRGKTAGAGQVRIDLTLDGLRSAKGPAPLGKDRLRQAFVDYMEAWAKENGLSPWADTAQIKGLRASCTPTWGAARARKLKYLPLKAHQNLRRTTYLRRSKRRLLGFEGKSGSERRGMD